MHRTLLGTLGALGPGRPGEEFQGFFAIHADFLDLDVTAGLENTWKVTCLQH